MQIFNNIMKTTQQVLSNNGTLLTSDGHLIAPYDLEKFDSIDETLTPLGTQHMVFNSSITPFSLSYNDITAVHIINGMGVALGDSIIGLTAISVIKQIYPSTNFTLYRPNSTPKYVEELYSLIAGKTASINHLPWQVNKLIYSGICIDVGNHLFWPEFNTIPMIDFFLKALGVNPQEIATKHKSNGWLKTLDLPNLPLEWINQNYILFCPTASTPIRSIPSAIQNIFIDTLWDKYKLPILGFETIEHPHYTNIQHLSPNTEHFLAWVKHARFLLSCDTAAVHIAAGFDVPTTAIFSTISAQLRVRDYPLCNAITLDLPQFRNVHHSNKIEDLVLLENTYHKLFGTNQIKFI